MKKPLLFAALSRRVAGITEQAQLYFDTIRRTPVVITPAGESLPLENRSAKGSAGGYASLDSSTLIPIPQLGTGTPDGTKFLRDDRTWAVPAGGGGGAPTGAQYLTLATDGTLTAERVLTPSAPLSGSDGGAGSAYTVSLSGWSGTTDGDMLYRNGSAVGTKTPAQARTWLDLATYYQPLDAGLTSLTAADASAGLPYASGANTWATATYSGMLSIVSGAWKVVGLRESGGTDLAMGAAADGAVLRRSGTSIVGAAIGSVLQAWAAILDAIAALSSTGFIVRTGSGTVAARTLTAGDGIDVTYGDGVSGNPTVAVQASVKGFQLYELFTVIQPQGTVAPNVDGVGASITSAGVYGVNVSETDFPCTQYGDASASTSRFYVQGYFRMEAGTVTTDILFKMGSDISAGITVVFVGFSSNVALSTADPTGHRYTIRWARGTDTNWQLSVKDNTTQTLVDTGVAVTADYYYAVRFVATSSLVTVQISAAATVASAKSGIDAAGTTSASTNLPATANDLYAIATIVRSAAATTRSIKFGYWRTIQRPA